MFLLQLQAILYPDSMSRLKFNNKHNKKVCRIKMDNLIKEPDLTQYSVITNKEDVPTNIIVGGEGAKFEPVIMTTKWDSWLRISAPIALNGAVETMKDNAVEIELDNKLYRYYTKEHILRPNSKSREALEMEIIFAAQPSSMDITFDISYSKDLVFEYQPSLIAEYNVDNMGYKTLDDFLKEHHRPDKVTGSYVVRSNKTGNLHRSGRFGAIYRPEVIDALGKRAWCTLLIEPYNPNIMVVRLPKEFMMNAIYPVVLDPLIGNDSNPGTLSGSTTYVFGTCNLAESSGTITSFGCYVEARDSTDPGIKMAIVETSGSCESEGYDTICQIEEDLPGSGRQDELGSGSGSITFLEYYYIAFICEGSNTKLSYDSGADCQYIAGTTYGAQFPSTWPATTKLPGARNYGIWANYTEGVVGAAGIMTPNTGFWGPTF